VIVEANSPAQGGRSRLLYPGLIFSLALNLLFLGGIGAAIWHHQNMQKKHGDYGLMRFAKDLPSARQDAFRQQVANARSSYKGQWDSVRTAWIEGNDLLTAEPFDKDKFKAAMAKLRQAENDYKTNLNNSFADIAASFTPEERKLLQSWRAKRKPWFADRTRKRQTDDNAKTD
jgi:uncharacterized membrane protein